MKTATLATAAEYARVFEKECAVRYPTVDAFEARMGHALAPERYLPAARVLACPIKAHAPNWQHGRVLYTLARRKCQNEAVLGHSWTFLDIGTAKGFSALCLRWALEDSVGSVHSVDVICPKSRERRNTVAELEAAVSLNELLEAWPEAKTIQFHKSTGRKWLTEHPERVHLAFVDGKHDYSEVSWEAALLASRQETGDVIMFDDVHIPGVARAVSEIREYMVGYLDVLPHRRYAIARKL